MDDKVSDDKITAIFEAVAKLRREYVSDYKGMQGRRELHSKQIIEIRE